MTTENSPDTSSRNDDVVLRRVRARPRNIVECAARQVPQMQCRLVDEPAPQRLPPVRRYLSGGRLKPPADLPQLATALKDNPTHEQLVAWVRKRRRESRITRIRPPSDFPELIVTVPDAWDTVVLAPLYDVHIGHSQHDAAMFKRHLRWIRETPNVLTWNGGDLIENASKLSVGSGVYEQDLKPDNQLVAALLQLADVAHKMLFALPGNHEDRTDVMGFSIASWLSMLLETPYFSDYCFCTIRWRGNKFRLLAHHGTGAAQTAGGQRMAARKDIAWAKPFDLFWTGHLHSPLVDVLYQTDYDQRTDRIHERNGVVLISPSYLKYHQTYAAKKRFPPGSRGLTAVTLHADGRIDTNIHANGKRL